MKINKITLSLIMALAMVVGAVVPAFAYANSVTYSGQGLIADGFGGYDLVTEICDGNINGILENGADAEGPYLLWVLTANKADNADITGPWGTASMTKFGNGTFKYISGWYDPDTLPGNVVATYDGKKTNAQLTISHGCRPLGEPGWCSPGFWMNATDAAWVLTGYSKTSLFNETVYDYFYGATFDPDPTLYYTLTAPNPSPFKGAPVPGTSGYPLNAYNATGAFLTDNIAVYDSEGNLHEIDYNYDVMVAGKSDACPIDHFGDYKGPATLP